MTQARPILANKTDIASRKCVELIQRSDNSSGFQILPRRWLVERGFSWLVRGCRESRK